MNCQVSQAVAECRQYEAEPPVSTTARGGAPAPVPNLPMTAVSDAAAAIAAEGASLRGGLIIAADIPG